MFSKSSPGQRKWMVMVAILLAGMFWAASGGAANFGFKKYNNVKMLIEQGYKKIAKGQIIKALKEDASNPWVHLAIGYWNVRIKPEAAVRSFQRALKFSSPFTKGKIRKEIFEIVKERVKIKTRGEWVNGKTLGGLVVLAGIIDKRLKAAAMEIVATELKKELAAQTNPGKVLAIVEARKIAGYSVDWQLTMKKVLEWGRKSKDWKFRKKCFDAIREYENNVSEEFSTDLRKKMVESFFIEAQQAHRRGEEKREKEAVKEGKRYYYGFKEKYEGEFFEQFFPPPRTVYHKVFSRVLVGKGIPKEWTRRARKPFLIAATETGEEPDKSRYGDVFIIRGKGVKVKFGCRWEETKWDEQRKEYIYKNVIQTKYNGVFVLSMAPKGRVFTVEVWRPYIIFDPPKKGVDYRREEEKKERLKYSTTTG